MYIYACIFEKYIILCIYIYIFTYDTRMYALYVFIRNYRILLIINDVILMSFMNLQKQRKKKKVIRLDVFILNLWAILAILIL